MVDIVKPDISSVWAEAGAVIAPSNEKIKMGWTSEVPPHQYENFVQNRQDEMLAYLNQKGVPEWRTGTEYFSGKSFVQDAGKIYKANKNSGGLLPNKKPSTDATNEYWEQATFSLSDLKQAVGTSTKDVMSQKATSDAIDLKVDSTRVKQTTGVSTTDIMSQKAVTDALGTILPTPVVQSSGSSTTDVMSQKAVTDALNNKVDKGAAVTKSITLNGTTDNSVVMTDIVTELDLEIGDVIRIDTGAYNKLHTVEIIVANNHHIIVNYEHSGSRGNGSLKLPDFTGQATVTRIAKWFNAPLGLGQTWVNTTPFRTYGTLYTGLLNRPIAVAVNHVSTSGNPSAALIVDGVTVALENDLNSTSDSQLYADVPAASEYKADIPNGSISTWSELR